MSTRPVSNSIIKTKIYSVRGVNVMLDRDLAELYQVKTSRLNEQVKRNQGRFPSDFMFQLNEKEVTDLRSQFATANISPKSRSFPYVFTEYGTLMLASILNSTIAIQVNQMVIRAFVEIRLSINANNKHDILETKLKLIESRMSAIEANHLVDNTVLSSKITKLSQDTQDFKTNLAKFSATLDEFQSAHIIIERPDDEIEG